MFGMESRSTNLQRSSQDFLDWFGHFRVLKLEDESMSTHTRGSLSDEK